MLRRDLFVLASDPECPNEVLLDALQDLVGEPVAKVYIVYGSSGSYSDYNEWNVRAFLDEGKAKEFLEVCLAWLKEHGDQYSGNWNLSSDTREAIQEGTLKCEHDHYLQGDYFNGYEIEYRVAEVELGG